MLIFDRTHLHCSSSVIKGKKIGIATFTKKIKKFYVFKKLRTSISKLFEYLFFIRFFQLFKINTRVINYF